jgi:hypothetical protein
MVGVLPSRLATFSMAARKLRLAWTALSKLSSSLSAIAARTVPAQVRKSFAVISLPVIFRAVKQRRETRRLEEHLLESTNLHVGVDPGFVARVRHLLNFTEKLVTC